MSGVSLQLKDRPESAPFAGNCQTPSSQTLITYGTNRTIRESDENHDVSKYSSKSSTATLRRHLIEHHYDEWFSDCKRLKIPLKSKAAQNAMKQLKGSSDDTGTPIR
jgi:hypothetical protein